jgi:hypothetical protein
MNVHLKDWIPEMNPKITILTTDQLISTDLNLD